MLRIPLAISLLFACCACVAETHVHVLAIDRANPKGRPLDGVRIFYGSPGSTTFFASTDKNGVATGEIDFTKLPPNFAQQQVKKLTFILVDSTGQPMPSKDVEWTEEGELAKGFVVPIASFDATPISQTGDAASTSALCDFDCDEFCDPCMPMHYTYPRMQYTPVSYSPGYYWPQQPVMYYQYGQPYYGR